ncbi:J domain-containing protein [Lyngbya confervoides]|uniref:Molecular chaperone DnaJ n=1 Tax=Lyngbya confervoides BDU141951 TaxID=1574623 RepID=A0ABD4T0L5_9CYAN|nr:molecular chaperone DnaJ [Lyngbya confervoides]MCM1982311.1 hypothetical protein [Lyngbya confervoides BDU141951]
MDGGLVRHLSETAKALEQKRLELIDFEARLAERELDLATFQAELDAFERHYLQVVGMRQQELDRIEAQILDYEASLLAEQNFRPTGELKQLYRELAKQIHPDLATDPDERARREDLMAEVNRAYAAGDLARLQHLFETWNQSPESIQGDDTAAELMRTLRQIAQSQSRLQAIEEKIHAIEGSDLYRLWIKIQRAEQQGRHLLDEMSRQLDRQIQQAQQRLNRLKQQIR